RMAAKQVAQVAQSGWIHIQDRDFRSDSSSNSTGVETGDATTHHHHLSRSYPWSAAQKDAAASRACLQTPGPRLNCQPARNLAHRRKQRQTPVFQLDGFVAKRADATCQQGSREPFLRRQMKISEQNLAWLQMLEFGRLRLFDLQNHIRTSPNLGRR